MEIYETSVCLPGGARTTVIVVVTAGERRQFASINAALAFIDEHFRYIDSAFTVDVS